MAAGLRTSRAGVVVLSCSDPRLNPYQILGIDATLSKFPPASICPALNNAEYCFSLITIQKRLWFATPEAGPLTLFAHWLSYKQSGILEPLSSCIILVRSQAVSKEKGDNAEIQMAYCSAETHADSTLTDCGMTHFHDADIKNALLEVAPAEQSQINSSHFGEIVNGCVAISP